MENAAEALKMFFAVFVFSLALSVFFRMTSIAKDTTDKIFESIDKTTYINYNADISDGANRKVSFQDMIPTIYRYAQEGYGVTIIDPDEGGIVARFDLDTESQVSSCLWDAYRKEKASQAEITKSNEIKGQICTYLNDNIISKVNSLGFYMENLDTNSLEPIIKKIYATGEAGQLQKDSVYTSWLTSNTYQNNNITQRVNCDMYGGSTNFSLRNPGVNESDSNYIAGKHKSLYSNGLLGKYKDATFTESIVQLDRNEYIKDDNNQETDLLVFGTIRYTKKREIIYIKNHN